MTDSEEKYRALENVWDEQWPVTEPRTHPGSELDNADELTPFPGEVGTHDPIEAVRDAEPYTPAVDPPVLPGGREAIHVGTGFGFSGGEEAAHDPLPAGDEDLRDEAMLLLEQDALTSHFPLEVEVRNGVIRLLGSVSSIDDAEHAEAILSELPGVVDVVDETTLDPSLTG